MFFPEAMTEVELIAPSKDLLAVTKVLGTHGVFHQIDSTYLGLENLGPSTWQEKAATYSTLERRIQVIMQNLNLEEQYSGSSDFDSMVDAYAEVFREAWLSGGTRAWKGRTAQTSSPAQSAIAGSAGTLDP